MIEIDLNSLLLLEHGDDPTIEEPEEEPTFIHPGVALDIQRRELSADMERWRVSAPCANTGKYQWKNKKRDVAYTDTEFKQLCSECPFKLECLTVAICYKDEHFIWGGLVPDERKQIIKSLLKENENIFTYWKPQYIEIVKDHIKRYLSSNGGQSEMKVQTTT